MPNIVWAFRQSLHLFKTVLMENKPLDKVFADKCIGLYKEHCDTVNMRDLNNDEIFKLGFTDGFNLRDVFCGELKTLVLELEARVRELEKFTMS